MKKQTVAVLGASPDRSKYSNKAVRAYLQQDWDVFPVNPKSGTIEGLKVYAALADIPAPLDRITVYLPPPVAVQALPSIASVKPAELFINPGAESDELVENAKALGLAPILACSIIDLGLNPSQFPG